VIQIIGTKKDRETAKAIRFCKERSIAIQFVDLTQRSLSAGEWRSVFDAFEPLSLIDSEGAFYKKEGYAHRLFDAEEELVLHPQLLRLPILRSKGRVQVGFDEATLLRWGKTDE
jgi:arsenate reductase